MSQENFDNPVNEEELEMAEQEAKDDEGVLLERNCSRDITTSDELVLKCATQLSHGKDAVTEACYFNRANHRRSYRIERVMEMSTTKAKREHMIGR